MDVRNFVQEFIPTMDSVDKVYQLFVHLNYPRDGIFDSSYQRDISGFDFAKEEKEKIKTIYTVLNFDGKLPVFFIETKTLPISLIRYITRQFAEQYQRLLLLFTTDYQEYTFVFPEYERVDVGKHKLKITRLLLDRQNPYHTDLKTISSLAYTLEEKNWRDLWLKWKEAFDVKRVTDDFFEDYYKNTFLPLREGIEKQGIPRKDAHEFSQQCLNRIMFIYFVAKKRWLNNEPKFIKWFWTRYKEERNNSRQEMDSFYERWLNILFLEAFNNKFSHPSYLPQDVRGILQLAPYLNGGLFKRNSLDSLPIKITDAFFEEKILAFFEKYNFTIREELPLDIEVAVDPQMIGYVYESLANAAEGIYDQQDLGIFYTPRIEVDFMVRSAIAEYLQHHLPEVAKEKIYHFVFDEDKTEVEDFFANQDLWHKIEECLETIAVVDPACGSGAFLVGMLNVLAELYRSVNKHLAREMSDFEIKKRIINSTLYGVDVMPWAVHAAELRLWLQLVIESDLSLGDLKLQPLLPNLDLNLRVGDSLVQEIGGINLHLRDSSISPSLKGKLTSLKHEKEKYSNNDSTGKFKSNEAILHEEIRIFSEILDERIITLTKERWALEHQLQQGTQSDLFKEIDEDKVRVEKEKIAQKQKEIETQIEELKGIKSILKDPEKKPFVWDIDFAEIFGDKDGFDIVIGNPPYVRQEKIAPPNIEEVSLEDKRGYKEKLLKSIHVHFPFIKTIDKKSDYYIYFYLHGLALLNPKGIFCFITSNSWLDVGYGKDLQEFLLKYVPIKAIYDNQAKRSFEHADVNTIIALFGAPLLKYSAGKLPALSNIARFVMFKKPFEEVINSGNLISILTYDPYSAPLFPQVLNTPEFRVFPLKQEKLLEEGWEYPEDTVMKEAYGFNVGKYTVNKWGGKYLRAPDIFFTILEKGKGKLVRLGDIAEVRFGIKTGCNEFFYLPSKHFAIEKEEGYYRLIPKHKELPEDIEIEEKYLSPAIISPREVNKIAFRAKDLENLIFFCSAEGKKKSTGVQQYIKFGEKQKFHLGSTLKARNPWWQIKEHRNSNLIWAMMHARRHNVPFNPDGCEVDHNFFEIIPKGRVSSELLAGQATSTLLIFIKELFGRAYGGGSGPIKNEGVDIVQYLVISPETFPRDKQDKFTKCFEKMFTREIKDVFDELGINPDRPIRSQKPNPLPDRKALDDIVFDVLGLTRAERDEVYWSVCELVKNRLEKARSVKNDERNAKGDK